MSVTTEQVARANVLCAAIYDRHPTGCCWHIVLDDGNNDDASVEFCAKGIEAGGYEHVGQWWPMCKDGPCVEMVPVMRSMTVEQRATIRADYRDE